MTTSVTAPIRSRPVAFALFTITLGAIGWFASWELLTEFIKTLQSPGYVPNCNVSILVTCGPNMGSWQGSLLGFSNTIIGVSAQRCSQAHTSPAGSGTSISWACWPGLHSSAGSRSRASLPWEPSARGAWWSGLSSFRCGGAASFDRSQSGMSKRARKSNVFS